MNLTNDGRSREGDMTGLFDTGAIRGNNDWLRLYYGGVVKGVITGLSSSTGRAPGSLRRRPHLYHPSPRSCFFYLSYLDPGLTSPCTHHRQLVLLSPKGLVSI